MKYRRMPIEIESPEQVGYSNIRCNLTESSVTDTSLEQLNLNLDINKLALAYTDHLGKSGLRESISAEAPGLSTQDVLLTASAAAALFIVSTSLLDDQSHMIVMRPNYATNLETPRAIGCNVNFLDLSFEEKFHFSIEKLTALLKPQTRLISLTTPHNPTGMTLSSQDLDSVINLAEERNCYLLVDETYREMNYSTPTPWAASLSPRCISVSSFSKSYGLPGIRLGWIITRDPSLQELFLAAKEQIFICNSIIDEEIAFQVHLEKNRILAPILKNNLSAFETIKNWMNRQKWIEWVEPRGGVVCFPRIKLDSTINVDAFYNLLNSKYGTFVGPGHWFEMDRRFMRIGYGWPGPEELAQGLESITQALDEARGSRF